MKKDNLPKSRADARREGALNYYTRKSCLRGHKSPRRTHDGGCLECEYVRSLAPKRIAQSRKLLDRVREELRRLKERPCMDCEERYPWYVMEFDHKEGTQSSRKIKNMSQVTSKKALRVEAEKCDVICANCHAIRTHNRAVAAGKRKYW